MMRSGVVRVAFRTSPRLSASARQTALSMAAGVSPSIASKMPVMSAATGEVMMVSSCAATRFMLAMTALPSGCPISISKSPRIP